jgi:hypothetical protein
MASNPIPTTPGPLITLGTQMVAGLTAHETALGILQISGASMQFLVDNFASNEAAFSTARSTRQTASNTWTAAVSTLNEWLYTAKGVLAARFGPTWSTEWTQAGFTNHSNAIPTRIDAKLALALALKTYFTNNPSYQVASVNVTATQAHALRFAAISAQNALNAAITASDTAEESRDTNKDQLMKNMRMLIAILHVLMAGNDPRWNDFGLNMPDANVTPGQPLNLTAGMNYTGNVAVQCDAVPLAQRYRWRMRIVGQQENYVLVASTTDPAAEIRTVLPGQEVEIIVQAVNAGSQGVASAPVLYTKPALAAAPEPAAAASPRQPRHLPLKAFTPVAAKATAGNGGSSRRS